MANVNVTVEGSTIVIRIDATKTFGPSKSGKTTIVASTNGNQPIQTPAGVVYLGVNAYRK